MVELPPGAGAAGSTTEGDELPLVSAVVRSRLGMSLCLLGLLAVGLAAGDGPVAVRAPVVLAAALTLPGFPLVARLPLNLPTLLALDITVSMSVVAALSLVMVKLQVWHPMYLGLGLAIVAVGATSVSLTSARHAEAKHLLRTDAPRP